MSKKISEGKAMIITVLLFILLQLIKPFVVIFIYKELTDFHPTIVNNYEIYFMVIKTITHNAMKMSYTIGFISSEILFLAIPFLVYKKLLKS